MTNYKYKPIVFFSAAYLATWSLWIPATFFNNDVIRIVLMVVGTMAPATISLVSILGSGNADLKKDFFKRTKDLKRINWLFLILSIVGFLIAIVFSILVSVVFGQSLDQFAFTDFSLSLNSVLSLLIIIISSAIEEVGWRGYGEDAIASECTWLKTALIYSILWTCWHIPLFWVHGSYHYGLRKLGIGYALNFFVSIIPLGVLITYIYIKNRRSIIACVIFHVFVNFAQEKVAMTPVTKCVETFILMVFVIIVIIAERKLFLSKRLIE